MIPGWPGSCSQKWLTRVWLRDVVHDGPKMTGSSYRVPETPVAPGEKVPDSAMTIIHSMPVKSLITTPRTGLSITGRTLPVAGHAWAGDGEVARVDVSIDFGASWRPAELGRRANRYAWQGWSATLEFSRKGYYKVWARATDDKGTSQPFAVAWNPKGYLNNVMHRISVRVRELKASCSAYVQGELRIALTTRFDEIAEGCRVCSDEDDIDRQTLFVEYPTLYPSSDVAYVAPRVRIEAGARSALEPSMNCTVAPYIASELRGWSFEVDSIRGIAPERTYWEKLLILHGVYCGYRDKQRRPADRDRISRHYYDAAMITPTESGRSALSNSDLLEDVRNHNLIAFHRLGSDSRRPWSDPSDWFHRQNWVG